MLGEPFVGGVASELVAPAGADAVLKVQRAHRESEHEAAALALWDGDGAVRLLDAALEALAELPRTQGEQVLLHQDLHAGNVLAAQREPWLAIDPKPLTGEREFGIAPVVRSRELGHSSRDVLRRFDRLVSELGLDRERARGWTIAQTIAWAFDGEHQQGHAETARWLLEAR